MGIVWRTLAHRLIAAARPCATMKSVGSLLPEHEGLRRVLQWLAAQTSWDAKIIEEASCRFDLSPIDEEFLLQHFGDARRDTQNSIA